MLQHLWQHLVEFNFFAWGVALGGLGVYIWQNWSTVQTDAQAAVAKV